MINYRYFSDLILTDGYLDCFMKLVELFAIIDPLFVRKFIKTKKSRGKTEITLSLLVRNLERLACGRC